MSDTSSMPNAPTRAVPSQPASSGTNVLNQKFGPFPLWVYLAAIGVALYAYEKKKKATAATTTAAAATATGTGIDPTTGIPYSQESGAASQSALEQSLQANVGAPTTNPQWEANAESVLVGYGYPNVQVQSALNTYLAGGVLSSIQQEIVNATIAAIGAPPTAPSTTVNSPTTPPTSSPTPKDPTTAAPAPTTGTPASKGEGTITIGGKQYTILGRAGSKVFQVAGGAPVYFGNGDSVAQGSAAEAKAASDGGYAYTPVSDDSLVSKTATQQSTGKF